MTSFGGLLATSFRASLKKPFMIGFFNSATFNFGGGFGALNGKMTFKRDCVKTNLWSVENSALFLIYATRTSFKSFAL